jgi:hypothetical protein
MFQIRNGIFFNHFFDIAKKLKKKNRNKLQHTYRLLTKLIFFFNFISKLQEF